MAAAKRKPRRKTPQRKRESSKVPVVAEVSLRVLGYREEGEWIALALEMDLRGYGKTFDEAMSDLTDLVAMQIHFALYKGQPEMIFKEAKPQWFLMFEKLKTKTLMDAITRAGAKAEKMPDFMIRGLEIPPANVIAKSRPQFDRFHG